MTIKIVEATTGSGKTSWPAGTPYVVNSQDPRDLYLPHDTWRKHQLETLLWLTDSQPHSVVSLVRTKSLQRYQYDAEYKFDAHYGRVNFNCVHPKGRRFKCDQCLYLDNGGMQSCPVSSSCSYLLSKHKAMKSRKASLNYAYWMSANNWRNQFPPEMLFCDEAHNVAQIVLDWVGITIKEKDRHEWSLPDFPEVDSTKGCGMFVNRDKPPATDEAMKWLGDSMAVMNEHCKRIEKESRNRISGNGNLSDSLRKVRELYKKLEIAKSSIEQCTDDWFIRSGCNAQLYQGKYLPAFICRPLTARHHAKNYFTGHFKTTFMSATIGDPDVFAKEIGIDEFEFRAVPSQWPPESRPIHILDCPPMGYRKNESEKAKDNRFNKQADVIAWFIKEYPPDWPGLIHVTRKREEVALVERLSSRGLKDRVWCIPGKVESYIPTDHQLRLWNDRLNRFQNSILVTASFSEGYDGLREQINISAKVPYPQTGSPGSYEFAWMIHNKKRYDQTAAIVLAQQQGRNRRGRECDYDTENETRGANAIADGAFGRVRNKLPVGIQESIVE